MRKTIAGGLIAGALFVALPMPPAWAQDQAPRAPEERLFRMPPLRQFPDQEVGRPIGTLLQPLTGQLADYFGVAAGVLVASVNRNSPAAEAGLKAGDVITAVNDQIVRHPADVRDAVQRSRRRTDLDLTVVRDKQTQLIRIPAAN